MSANCEKALIAKLKTVSAVTSLTSTRIYPRIAPEGTGREGFIVVRRMPSGTNRHRLNGHCPLVNSMVMVACCGATYLDSRNIAEAVQEAGLFDGGTWGGVDVICMEIQDDYDESEIGQMADEIGRPIEALVFEMVYEEVA